MIKITVLMGSPRKKDSFHVCKLIEENFSKNCGVEFQYLFLADFHVKDCKGCDQCFQKGERYCPCNDDLPVIKEKLLQSDGIIFASPVYAYQITGTMKRTLDRLSYLFHRQEVVGKPALVVVTTGGGGQKAVMHYLNMTACGWGCRLVGKISVISPMFFNKPSVESLQSYNETYHNTTLLKLQAMAKDFERAVLNDSMPVPTFYDVFMFQGLRSKTFVSKADYDFWKEKGWLDSDYFYPVQLSFPKMLFARAVRWYVNWAAKKMLGKSR